MTALEVKKIYVDAQKKKEVLSELNDVLRTVIEYAERALRYDWESTVALTEKDRDADINQFNRFVEVLENRQEIVKDLLGRL